MHVSGVAEVWMPLAAAGGTCEVGPQQAGALIPGRRYLGNSGDKAGVQTMWRPSGVSANA